MNDLKSGYSLAPGGGNPGSCHGLWPPGVPWKLWGSDIPRGRPPHRQLPGRYSVDCLAANRWQMAQ